MENEIKNYNERVQSLAETLLKTESVYTIATRLAEFLIKEKERPNIKIAVTDEEWAAIQSLFRIRGVRANGEVETRGRRRRTDSD